MLQQSQFSRIWALVLCWVFFPLEPTQAQDHGDPFGPQFRQLEQRAQQLKGVELNLSQQVKQLQTGKKQLDQKTKELESVAADVKSHDTSLESLRNKLASELQTLKTSQKALAQEKNQLQQREETLDNEKQRIEFMRASLNRTNRFAVARFNQLVDAYNNRLQEQRAAIQQYNQRAGEVEQQRQALAAQYQQYEQQQQAVQKARTRLRTLYQDHRTGAAAYDKQVTQVRQQYQSYESQRGQLASDWKTLHQRATGQASSGKSASEQSSGGKFGYDNSRPRMAGDGTTDPSSTRLSQPRTVPSENGLNSSDSSRKSAVQKPASPGVSGNSASPLGGKFGYDNSRPRVAGDGMSSRSSSSSSANQPTPASGNAGSGPGSRPQGGTSTRVGSSSPGGGTSGTSSNSGGNSAKRPLAEDTLYEVYSEHRVSARVQRIGVYRSYADALRVLQRINADPDQRGYWRKVSR